MTSPTIRFAAIGLNHNHIYGQTRAVLDAGGELVSFHAVEDDLAADYAKAFPQARRVKDQREILEDRSIQLVVSATIPDVRAATAIAVMRHGKDVMVDKPGVITLDELAAVRKVQAETGRIFSVCFSERFENRATEKASQLVAAGAIGRVVQTMGMGPHALRNNPRPDWFFERKRYGGILCDIAAHQCDQFLHFTGSTRAEVVASHIGNFGNPETPELEDFGEVLLRGNGGTGFIRVDWFTPKGLGVWGDGRLTILGTEGYIELRKYVDIAGRPGGDHLFLVDGKGTQHMDCKAEVLPYGPRLIQDILNRTETSMSQAHCFLATELALKAEALATRVGGIA
ncbi:Predicted dehydrogenase [Rhodoferax sp. OV413]|uniref:Gfo/Idh/MocA family protein n=1 Tax=Rhodoferax sp. OV413 TaxID=1855285 RepID=UPI000885E301|nr:Gfo/Idh/MocA family oxidoreductase [Rhodoferax sp. OV413]SDP16444.1 Predicted dehydrogenase [Rhodoferax sp. OV413]